MFRLRALIAALGLVGLAGTATVVAVAGGLGEVSQAPYAWRLPAWLPPPLVPASNPMSDVKIELGRRLFYDRRLSSTGTMSCASCHLQALAFTDARMVPKGVTCEVHSRNSMSLANVAYFPVLTWSNPLLSHLEQQSLVPLFGEAPVELGLSGLEGEMLARLKAEPVYPPLFAAAFPDEKGAISLGTVTKALAAFERTLISADSPYDRHRYGGDRTALSASALRGESLFFSERLECFHCHGGVHLTDNLVHTRKPFAEAGFHNNGLYNTDGEGAFPTSSQGLIEHTGRPDDMGRFRTPSLRNVAVTAPYMHDGSIPDLRGVIAHYSAGGRTITEGPNAGVGSGSPLKSPFLPGFKLTRAETDDLIAFLESLTDRTFLTDPRFSNPWQEP
ncbi:methanobactin export MATE transporter MbnM [Ancylobacter lacus]|uniref:methanobactin export MATE transporter MbnM n=1 Tax=Ancylobacter lacus TaxID=2579970 RepID=UPI001BCFEF80|nr:methanobactin export MATE transporter MbnM [Ancylobacter lacus]MBS7538891.1 di-heme enzyme [Ancylobacter lacus]